MTEQKPRSFLRRRWWVLLLPLLTGGLILLLLANEVILRVAEGPPNAAILRWFNDDDQVQATARAELVSRYDAPCPGYPFLVPSAGFVGGLPYNAPYGPYNYRTPHPGIDIFGLGSEGTVPVYAAYDGWLTREDDWLATVIIRHDDPLHPGQTIWTYYTHMANYSGTESYIAPEFPPGTGEILVEQGQFLGYQGIYNGGPNGYSIAMHLHFSVVKSGPDGSYLNEAIFTNTLDPTRYLGLALNDAARPQYPLRCLPPPGEAAAQPAAPAPNSTG